jgi:hypothetical protein
MQIYGSVSNPTDPANVWPGDGIVRGLIEGLDCSAQQNSYGGYAISVLPESVKPGCGAEGKYVQFTVGGQATMHALRWQPGQYQFDLQIEPGQGAERSGTARATSVVRPPDTGDGGLR